MAVLCLMYCKCVALKYDNESKLYISRVTMAVRYLMHCKVSHQVNYVTESNL